MFNDDELVTMVRELQADGQEQPTTQVFTNQDDEYGDAAAKILNEHSPNPNQG